MAVYHDKRVMTNANHFWVLSQSEILMLGVGSTDVPKRPLKHASY